MIRIFSNAVVPLIILFIVLYGLKKKINIYDSFVDGARESFDLSLNIFPSMLAMIFGVNIFIKSGFVDVFFNKLFLIFPFINLPYQIIPMFIMRPISGSSSLGILTDIFSNFGPDSFMGVLGSILQGSTETTFYILTVYFGSVGIKKIRYALFAGLVTDIICILISIFIVNLIL